MSSSSLLCYQLAVTVLTINYMILLLHAACNNVLSNSEQHRHHINDYNNAICNGLSITSITFIAMRKFSCSQDFIDPRVIHNA